MLLQAITIRDQRMKARARGLIQRYIFPVLLLLVS